MTMTASKPDEAQVVMASLCGKRTVDEKTHSAISVLAERLETLKKTSPVFSDIAFSATIEQMAVAGGV